MFAQVHQQRYAQIRAGNAADRHRQHDFSAHCAFEQMHDAGGNLGEEIKERIAADGDDGRNMQAEDEHGQQQNAAAQSRQSDQRSQP